MPTQTIPPIRTAAKIKETMAKVSLADLPRTALEKSKINEVRSHIAETTRVYQFAPIFGQNPQLHPNKIDHLDDFSGKFT